MLGNSSSPVSAATAFPISTTILTESILSSLPALDALLADFHTNHPQNVVRPQLFQKEATKGVNPDVHDTAVIDMVDLRTQPPDNYSWEEDGGNNNNNNSNVTDPIWMPHCHVVGMLPFTPFDNASLASLSTYEEAAAMALALEHLNTHNGSIVDDLAYLQDTCAGMVFTLEFLDTHYTPGAAIDDVFAFSSRTGRSEGLRPCSFLGAARSAVTLPTSLLTGHRGYVQVSATSTSFQLDEVDQYPLFGRTVPSDLYNVIPMIEYFQQNLRITHLAVLTLNEAFGQSFGQAIQLATSLMASQGSGRDGQQPSVATGTSIRIHRINMDSTSPQGIQRALENLQESKFRYVLAALLTKELHQEVLLQAVDMDLAGNGKHQWFFPDSFELFESEMFDGDNDDHVKLLRAYQGIGVFVPSAKTSRSSANSKKNRYEKFKAQMSQINNPTDIAYLNNILPHYGASTKVIGGTNDDNENEQADTVNDNDQVTEDDSLQPTNRGKFGGKDAQDDDGRGMNRNPLTGGGIGGPSPANPTLGGFGDRFKGTFLRNFPFLHDETFLNPVLHDSAAFMYDATILMGLSACRAVAQKTYGEAFSGQEQFEFLKQTSFHGVTGELRMDAQTGSRTFDSTTYELINFVAETLHFENGTVKTHFKAITTDIYHGHVGEWEFQKTFIFNDGTSTIPSSLPPPDGNGNYIATGVRAVAWTFAFISVFLAIGFAVWTYRNRKSRVVKASQPFFLYLICSGVILVASSTIPSSFDSQFAPVASCSRACTAATWLLFLGVSIVFSSLFTKAYRINLIMMNAQKFRRVTITIAQTLRPMGALLTANVIILTVMTVMNPPQYKINTVATSNDAFGRPRESYGICAYNEQGWFFLALAILNGGILVLSMLQSWHARGLATEFAESKYVFLALASTTVVVFVGAPVLVLARDTPNAVLFLGSSINFVFCLNILLLMFVPKVLFRQKSKSVQGHVKISGLSQSIFRREKTNNPATEGDDFSTIMRISDVATSEETDGTGERILTTQSARQLAKLVARLQRKLEAKEEELQFFKQQRDNELAEARQEQFRDMSTIQQASCKEVETGDFLEDSEMIQQQQLTKVNELIEQEGCRSSCSSANVITICNAGGMWNKPGPSTIKQFNNKVATQSLFDEENPSPLPISTSDSDHMTATVNAKKMKRVSVISQLTDSGELSLRPSVSYETFHVPSGLPLAESDGTKPVTDSLTQKTAVEFAIHSQHTATKRDSCHDDAGSSSPLSSASADDLVCRKDPPVIVANLSY